MVDNEKVLQDIHKKIEVRTKEAKEEKKEQTQRKDVVLFFSFDVVNSTSYKTVNYYGWAQVLNVIFKEIREEVQTHIQGSEIWRVLGDEAIFIQKITDENLLCEYINKIFRILISTISKLKEGAFFEHYDEKDFLLLKLQNTLSLKAAAWIATVKDVGNIDNKIVLEEDAENIFETYQTQEGNIIFEFLGNDIDTGFRISKHTEDGRMVLSFELAYLISRKTDSLSCLHIITYRKLKGVWKDKLYPIIWYHNPNTYLQYSTEKLELEESFMFDASDESSLIKEYYENRDINNKNRVLRDIRMFTEPNYAFKKILRDRGLTEKIERLQQIINEPVKDQTKKYMNIEYMQIHCVAVCFKYEKKSQTAKILIAKRSENREKHKGQWEFGCAKAVINKSIGDRIKEEYKQDFGIDIEPVYDENRTIKEPIPIALYNVEHKIGLDNNNRDKGIITLAEIKGDYNIEDFQSTVKHDQVQWITKEELSDIKTKFPRHVPDFEQTLSIAFKRIEEFYGKTRDERTL